MESGLGGEWYSLHTRVKVRPSGPRQGDARQHSEQREMLQDVRATGVDLLGCWYRDGVISTIPHVCRGERQYMHLTRHINPVTATIIVAA